MPVKHPRYPHLLPPDAALWERFMQRFPNRYHAIEYDVRVGEGRDPGPEFETNIRQMGLDLSMRRIDALGYTDHYIDVIEITHSAGTTALGQLQLYPLLYQLKFKPTLPLLTLLVAGSLQSDIAQLIDDKLQRIVILPELGPELVRL